jgi:hypothetical protein
MDPAELVPGYSSLSTPQAEAVKTGRTPREQFRFKEYLHRRAQDPAYSFRKHLRSIGGAIEE